MRIERRLQNYDILAGQGETAQKYQTSYVEWHRREDIFLFLMLSESGPT